MKKRIVIPVSALVAAVIVVVVVGLVLSRQRPQRHRVFRIAPPETRAQAPAGIPPVEQWSETFERLPPKELSQLLDQIAAKHADLYAKYSLGYLHARALLEQNELRAAAEKLAPFAAAGSPFRDLALYHQSEISDAAGDRSGASRARQELITSYPDAFYRDEAIDDEADYLASEKNLAPLVEFAKEVAPTTDVHRRRELSARIVEGLVREGNIQAGFANGMAILTAGTTDDAADRTARALDTPRIVEAMNPAQKAMLGETMYNHRHYDRAVALLSAATAGLPAKRDELQFAVGRSWFGAEKYAEAAQTYLKGAAATNDPKAKSTFLFHASRATQLQGDDAGAERLMTAALAIPGKFPSTTAALTQRLRTRAKQRRFAEAAADLQQLRKIAPNEHSIVEGSLAHALALLGAGNSRGALSVLNSVPPKLLNKYDAAEYAYWRGRCLEPSDPHGAFAAYLTVLRATVPTHFAFFARERLNSPSMQGRMEQELAVRDAQVKNLVASKQYALAKQIETDRILLSPRDRSAELARLAEIYRQIPAYANVLALQPEPLPRIPTPATDRGSLLMAMGLYDEAADQVKQRYPLRPLKAGLTQSLALNRGNASRDSIYAVEVLMKGVPSDYLPDLLPLAVRQLLYPRYFYPFIEEDSKRYGADPVLVLSIMREESRFNPRAKSEAAARGLLQFIITTAREIGRDVGLVDVDPQDLYDPRVIIRLGAKYISTLQHEFGGDHYMTAGAYNAGPKQVALWSRLAPAPGDDWFLSTINFDETKDYVRKVMNSYKRYGEIYGNAGPQGGLRAEP